MPTKIEAALLPATENLAPLNHLARQKELNSQTPGGNAVET